MTVSDAETIEAICVVRSGGRRTARRYAMPGVHELLQERAAIA
ncbi:hypothetical protein [Nocardia aurea]|nr:hypothetical protein [Nocardia aurea]